MTDAALFKLRESHWDRLRQIGPFKGLQIVPTYDDHKALHELLTDPVDAGAPVDLLDYHGGRTITQPKVFNLYLDAFPGDRNDFDDFTRAIVESGYYVSPDGRDTSNGAFLGSQLLPSGMTGTVKDSQLGTLVTASVGRTIPQGDLNTNFNIIMPPGLQVAFDDGSGVSCKNFCGYHTRTASGVYYSVICDPTCVGCHGSFMPEEARMMVTSHEYTEWRSDPDGDAWYNTKTGAENGDECAWRRISWLASKGWVVQPQAVNGRGCIVGDYQPPLPPIALNWRPQPGLPLSVYFGQLIKDASLLDPTLPAGQLLQYVLAHPNAFQQGQPLEVLLGWLQSNPGYVDTEINGQGWGAYLDDQQVA